MVSEYDSGVKCLWIKETVAHFVEKSGKGMVSILNQMHKECYLSEGFVKWVLWFYAHASNFIGMI